MLGMKAVVGRVVQRARRTQQLVRTWEARIDERDGCQGRRGFECSSGIVDAGIGYSERGELVEEE